MTKRIHRKLYHYASGTRGFIRGSDSGKKEPGINFSAPRGDSWGCLSGVRALR